MNSVTFTNVEHAIAELIRLKKPLTLANIRQQLGDRGSMTTLSKYLQQWKSSKFLEGIPVQTASEPAPDQIMTAVQTVWHQMLGHGQEQLTRLQEEFALKELEWIAEREQLQLELSLRFSSLESLQQTYTQLQLQEKNLEQQHQRLLYDFGQLETSLLKEKEFNKRLELKAQEERAFLEQSYQARHHETVEAYKKAQEHARTEAENLKTLIEQQRHEHALAFDRVQVEYRNLQSLHQHQKTSYELMQDWLGHTQAVKNSLSSLKEQQVATELLLHQTYTLISAPKTWAYAPLLLVDFYQNIRFRYRTHSFMS